MNKYLVSISGKIFTIYFGRSTFHIPLTPLFVTLFKTIPKSIFSPEHFTTELVNRGTHFKYST